MEFNITSNEQEILLTQAREVITAELENRKPSFTQIGDDSALNMPCGAFVSLHMQKGQNRSLRDRSLRGCIGRMTANLPLIETVRVMAKEAAFGDPRFPPLKKEELTNLHIEISALSPMTICTDPQKVEVGVHGLYLMCNGRSGVLLPQVPVEQKWSRQEYSDYICIKAGLPAESYKSPKAALYTFTAIVFGEE